MKVRVSVLIGSLCLKMITRALDNVTILSITAVRVTITHEMANTKAVLQAILVQILTVASIRTFKSILLIYTINTGIYLHQMINMCANTNTNTTIVTTLSTQVPTLCRFSTSDALERGGFEGASCYGVSALGSQMVFVSKVPECLESAEMQGGDMPQPHNIHIYSMKYETHSAAHTTMVQGLQRSPTAHCALRPSNCWPQGIAGLAEAVHKSQWHLDHDMPASPLKSSSQQLQGPVNSLRCAERDMHIPDGE